MPQKAQPVLKSCHPFWENQTPPSISPHLFLSLSFPPALLRLPISHLCTLSFFFPQLLHLCFILFLPWWSYLSLFLPFFPSISLGAEMHWIIQNGGLIYKSACSAQTSQSRSSVWRLIMAKERHGSLICNDTLQFLNWCTTSAQCVLNALE